MTAMTVDELREAMIAELREMGAVRSDGIAEVFRQVPRHLFTPGASLEEAYDARDAVHMKHDETGVPISTVSSPQLQAGMLEQADIQPGDSALEIGSGGVNAAMMSWLARRRRTGHHGRYRCGRRRAGSSAPRRRRVRGRERCARTNAC